MESSTELARRWRDWKPSREEGNLRWGLPWLESALPTPHPGSLTVLGGRTNVGKSFLALALLSAASKSKPALYVSLEDPELELGRRLSEGLATEGLHCSFPTTDRLSATVDEVRAAGRAGFGWVCADYVQALAYDGGVQAWSKADAVGRCVSELKAEARAAKVALLLVSQLRRPSGGGEGPVPPPSIFELKETGTLENAAEYVLLVGASGERVRVVVAKAKGAPTGASARYARGRGGVLVQHEARDYDDI